MRTTLALLLAAALLVGAGGCSDRQHAANETKSASEAASTSAAKPSDSQSMESTSNASTLTHPESEPQELYDGGQGDPTIQNSHQAPWEHIEYKNFGSPDSWKTTQQKAYQDQDGVQTGDPLVVTLRIPKRVSMDETFRYDGDFAQGSIKMGGGLSSIVPLPSGETAAHNTIQDYSSQHFGSHPLTGESYSMTETAENQVGGYCYGSRGEVSFARYIGAGASAGNILLQYVVQLGDSVLTEAYFYVAENASADDLKIYDEIILSIQVK